MRPPRAALPAWAVAKAGMAGMAVAGKAGMAGMSVAGKAAEAARVEVTAARAAPAAAAEVRS